MSFITGNSYNSSKFPIPFLVLNNIRFDGLFIYIYYLLKIGVDDL